MTIKVKHLIISPLFLSILAGCGTGGTKNSVNTTKDTISPSISFSPATLTLASGATGKATLTATDNIGVNSGPTVSCTNGGSFSANTFTAPSTTQAITSVCTATASDAAGNKGTGTLKVTISGSNTAGLRTMQEELDFVGKKAQSLLQNDLGYWEADFGNGLVMIYVPKGEFIMGNNYLSDGTTNSLPSAPEHEVFLNHYWISKTPITKGQFRAFVKAESFVTDVEKPGFDGPFVYDFPSNGFTPKKGYHWDNAFKDVTAKYPEITVNDQHPVSCVSWNDSIAYTNWLKAKKGLSFTLPTEAEWEFAARGTDQRIYPWGNQTPDGTLANYADETFDRYFPNTGQSEVHKGVNDGYAITSPVGSFPAGQSPVGALDMAGNLTEWIYDSEYNYTASRKDNPIHKTNTNIKLQKAGFWAGSAGRRGVTPNEIINGHNIRSDARQGDDLNSADDHLGFRIAISYTNRN